MSGRRRQVDLANGAAALAALALAALAAAPAPAPGARPGAGQADRAADRHRERHVTDARGRPVAVAPFRRIVSASMVADGILLELCEPQRIAAFSRYARSAHRGYRFSGRPARGSLRDLESLLALRPDLVIVDGFAPRATLDRLRSARVAVFDIGPMRGLQTLLPAIRRVGALVGRRTEAERFARQLGLRMRRIAEQLEPGRRKSALYLGIIGETITGGTRGSAFHDVLVAAGLSDRAAGEYAGWPRLTSEQILALDPQLIVTQSGMRAQLCRHPGLDALRACRTGSVLEMRRSLIGDAGLAMPAAAEALHRRVYGARSQRAPSSSRP